MINIINKTKALKKIKNFFINKSPLLYTKEEYIDYLSTESLLFQYSININKQEVSDYLLLEKAFIKSLDKEKLKNFYQIINEIKKVSDVKRKEARLIITYKNKSYEYHNKYNISNDDDLDKILDIESKKDIDFISIIFFDIYEILNAENKKDIFKKVALFLKDNNNNVIESIKNLISISTLFYTKSYYYQITKDCVF